MKWNKSKKAAVLAAAFLVYGGTTVCAYQYENVQQSIGAKDGNTEEGSSTTYTDEVYADAKGTLNLSNVEIATPEGKFSAQGGTINVKNSTVSSSIWAVRAPDNWEHMDTANYYGGKVEITGSTTNVSAIHANGAGSSVTFSGGTVKAEAAEATKTVMADDKEINDAENTTGGRLEFKDGVDADLGSIQITGPESQLTVSGDASVTADSLTVKAETEEQSAKVDVTGGALDVNNAVMENSNMTITGGSVQMGSWTATGGATTVGSANADGASLMAEEDALTVDGTAKLNDHDLIIESGKTVSQGALEAANGTVVTVNGTLNVEGLASLDGSKLTSDGKTTAGSLTAKNQSEIAVSGALTVKNDVSLDGSTLTSDGTTNLGSLTAGNGSTVTVNAEKTLTVDGNASLNGSTLTSKGTTTLGSLTSTGDSKVTVSGGTFNAGTVNTNQFYVEGGKVTIGGGTMTGDVGTKEDGSDGKSALYINGSGTVNATDVTFTGGEVAVDNGGILNLTGGTVNVPTDSFTTEGGTITTDGTTIKSGIWAHDSNGKDGIVTLNKSTLTGGTIGAQDGSEITMNGGTADVDNVVLEGGSTITFNKDTAGKGAVVKAGSITASGTETNTLNIQGGSQVTAGSLKAESSNISIVGSGSADDSHLTINGDADLSQNSTVTMTNVSNAAFNGKVTIDDTSSIAVTGTGTSATFASGSKLYVNSTEPAVTVSGGAKLTFDAGSSVYTTASTTAGGDGKYAVNTVAKAEDGGTIKVEEKASLYITNLDAAKTYSLAQVVAGNTDPSSNGWAGNAYGSSMLQVVNKESGQVENRDFDTAYQGTVLASAVYDAVMKDSQDSAAYKFAEAVTTGHAGASDASEIARIANALNSHTGMTGLAGAGYGTYRFTTAFTDAAANHEEGDLWASYLHDKSSVDGLSVGSLSADYDLTFDGAIVGSDFYHKGNTTIGAAFAYADGDISTKSGVSTENDVDYYGGMIYGSVKGAAGMTYRAEIGYNRSSNDITQTNTGTVITGSVDADAFHVGVSAEKEILSSAGTWTPFVGLQYIDLSMDDYSDSLGFRHEGDSAGIWNMPLGVNYKYEMERGGWTYAPAVTVGYRFTFGDDSLNETLRYNGTGSTFGTEIAEDSFFTRIGLTAKKDNLGFGVHYGYERGSNTEANQWGIDCSFYF